MKIGFLFVLSKAIIFINCQTVFDFNDKLLPFVKQARFWGADFVKPRTFETGYRISLKNNVCSWQFFPMLCEDVQTFHPQKIQPEFKNQSFFCDVNGPGRRSNVVPTSVHRLTPGDIDVIGAIGDSLTSANGAFAINSLQTTLEGRGVSWSIGGKDNWRKFITLPNLIKEFNPNLYGFSEAPNSLGYQKESKFNVAEPGATTNHIIRQAKNLVKRMRSDRNVDIKNHWKVVTMMIGSNDFCLDICYFSNQDKLIEVARSNMVRALRILRENLPRTLVNLVVPVGKRKKIFLHSNRIFWIRNYVYRFADVTIIFGFKQTSRECQGFHWLECPCMVSLSHQKSLEMSLNTVRKWKVMVKEVADMPEFHDREVWKRRNSSSACFKLLL